MKKTNVIYIHTHDTGRMIEPYGYVLHTPNLTALAKDAVLFRQAYCVSPTCSPSRASLLTGCYPHENGMLGLAQRGFQLDVNKHLVPFLNQHGYQSVLCGIQHEAGWYLDHEKGAEQLGYHINITSSTEGYRQEDMCIWDHENAKQAVQFLKSYDQKEPLFLSYGMYATHRRYPDQIDESIDENYITPPYPIPDSAENRNDHARFLTSLLSADQNVGLIIESLKENGLYENSIIIFTTDHGLANPFSKCTLFDSGIGVSLIMRVPKAKNNGRVSESLISHVDVFPTLCELLDMEKPEWLRGMSFAGEFQSINSFERKNVFTEINFHTSYEPVRCIRSKRYKYIRYYDAEYLKINLSNIDSSAPKEFFLQHGLMSQLKYEEALYDTYFDLGERRNLIDDVNYHEVLIDMRQELDVIMKESNDPLLYGNIPFQDSWKINKKECVEASSKNADDYVSCLI